jgi:hypothetical protein
MSSLEENGMTVREYNKEFYPKYNKAVSFISCLTHTVVNKCDDNTLRQLKIIGWDEETEKTIQDALYLFNELVRADTHFYGTDEETAEKIEEIRMHCTELCSGGVQCLECTRNKDSNYKDDRMEFIECLLKNRERHPKQNILNG